MTLRRSHLGPKALEQLYVSLVGIFHGYSHNCLCQLTKLVLYLEGMGLKDFKTFLPPPSVTPPSSINTRPMTPVNLLMQQLQASFGYPYELEYLRTRVKAEVPECEKLEIEYYLLLVKFKETWLYSRGLASSARLGKAQPAMDSLSLEFSQLARARVSKARLTLEGSTSLVGHCKALATLASD
ncbi:hypothetical protein C8J56DRAFT_883299 [Mycena floridula]|nr:hypothetical protein C8J56DRAFT_883299 [Mycena floridula]